MFSEEEKQAVVKMFSAYCRRALRNAKTDILREEARFAKRETLFSDMRESELNCLSAPCPFVSSEVSFNVGDFEISVVGEELADAIASLTKEDREAILLYYFADWTDRRIADKYDCPRSTIQFRRARALRILRDYFGKEATMDDYL